jgi:hypothetical protein
MPSSNYNFQLISLEFIFISDRPSADDIFNQSYFWFFLIFLNLRTFGGLFLSSRINEAAREPLMYIRNIPNHQWNLDVR